jgi:hypothetical protein
MRAAKRLYVMHISKPLNDYIMKILLNYIILYYTILCNIAKPLNDWCIRRGGWLPQFLLRPAVQSPLVTYRADADTESLKVCVCGGCF